CPIFERRVALFFFPKLLQVLQRLLARTDARRTEHDDRVPHFFAAQAFQRIDILRDDAHGPCRQTLHEDWVAVGRIDFPVMALTAHETSTCNGSGPAAADPRNWMRFLILRN